jgi:tetratricopeptide (TPR) repeat protein/predicted Ser/Thr protein kinase
MDAELALIQKAREQAEHARAARGDGGSSAATADALHPRFGGEIANYALTRELHRGGQGVVYLARQHSTDRDVAIKVMREGPFAGPSERVRFEQEVRLLAELRHPNIVAIHDSGQSAGFYYFVMDYIEGESLDEYISSRRPSVRDTLTLFMRICDAVNAAHLRGVMHRDLKPGNIRIDDDGAPHVLDFGLAKRSDDASRAAAVTQTGQFVGSLPWSSPEQAEGRSTIDIRSDVYSIGVMLYHAMTGRFPYDVSGGMRDALDNIARTDPVRPRLIRSGIDDEVETIILKCLSKSPDRRYMSAGELARDMQRYLSGAPIDAKRDSAAYMLRKTLRRYRAPIAVTAGFFVVVTVGLIVTVQFWRQALADRAKAESSSERFSREAAKTAAVNRFLDRMLASADPFGARTGDVPVRDVLDAAASEIDKGAYAGQPEVEAALRSTIGRSYRGLGAYALARRQFERALALRRGLENGSDAEVADSLHDLGRLDVETYSTRKAEATLREALELRIALFGDQSHEVQDTRYWLARLAFIKGRIEETDELCRTIIECDLPPTDEHDTTLVDAMHLYASSFNYAGDVKRMRYWAERALERQRMRFGPDHPHVAAGMIELSKVAQAEENRNEMIALYDEALRIREASLGPDHPDTLGSYQTVGRVCLVEGRFDEAETYLRRSLEGRRAVFGEYHSTVGSVVNDMVLVMIGTNRLDEAERLAGENLRICRKVYGELASDVVGANARLATIHMMRGDVSGARPYSERALAILDEKPAWDRTKRPWALSTHAWVQLESGELESAEQNARDALAQYNDIKQPSVRMDGMATCRCVLGACLTQTGRFDEAAVVLQQAYDWFTQAPPLSEFDRRLTAQHLIELHTALGDDAAADQWRERLTRDALTAATPTATPASNPIRP